MGNHGSDRHASVTLRLGEVMRNQPLPAVLYERGDKGEPSIYCPLRPTVPLTLFGRPFV